MGKNSTDNSIVLQEAVHSMNSMGGKQRFMVIKLDLTKAYDKMEWHFIFEALELLSFPRTIIDLVQECLATSWMCVNWQGRASDEFAPERGLRQGDPLSPLLFVIALERLSHCIADAVNDGSWQPLKFGRGSPSMSHLMFADDIILISEASLTCVQKIMEILQRFNECSGQTVNRSKSCVFFSQNMLDAEAQVLSSQLGIATMKDLGRYLGIPIISGRKGKEDYSFLVDKVRAKLSGVENRYFISSEEDYFGAELHNEFIQLCHTDIQAFGVSLR